MSAYRLLFDHVATRVDAEAAHGAGFRAIRVGAPVLARTVGRAVDRTWGPPIHRMGIDFPAVLGLAAGFDKNAVGIDALAALGFGFVEVGTVTGEPQPGNPRPRLFRLPADRAVVNRMGFNNDGAERVAKRLAQRLAQRLARRSTQRRAAGQDLPARLVSGDRLRRHDVPVGINIGKTKVVPEENAVDDYRKSARLLAPYADYLVVNVSSPNTPGLRDLQAVEKLQPLLSAVRREADAVTEAKVPLLVKIAPDLSDDDVLAVADLAVAEGLDGIVATNTTISREGLRTEPPVVGRLGAGGLSGAPLTDRALAVTRLLRGRVGDELTVVAVGGITTVEDALARLEAGADLLQGYTAFVYEGPSWPARLNRALARRHPPDQARES